MLEHVEVVLEKDEELTFDKFCDMFVFQLADRPTMARMERVINNRKMENAMFDLDSSYRNGELDTDLIKMVDVYYKEFSHYINV